MATKRQTGGREERRKEGKNKLFPPTMQCHPEQKSKHKSNVCLGSEVFNPNKQQRCTQGCLKH